MTPMTDCRDMVLQFEGISKSFGHDPVLRDLDLDLPRGSMVALVGPNGAGKSTLLKLACGLIQPSQGRVRLCGKDPAQLAARQLARLTAYLPQSYPTDLPYSGLELVLTGRRAYLGPFGLETQEDQELSMAVMDELGVKHLAARKAATLSGGELQLLMAASALVQQAPLFLADEPTSDLDPSRQADLMRVLRRRSRREGLTLLAAIHDANLAAAWFDEIVFVSQGQIVSKGSPSRVFVPEILTRIYGDAIFVTRIDGRPVILPLGPRDVEALS